MALCGCAFVRVFTILWIYESVGVGDCGSKGAQLAQYVRFNDQFLCILLFCGTQLLIVTLL